MGILGQRFKSELISWLEAFQEHPYYNEILEDELSLETHKVSLPLLNRVWGKPIGRVLDFGCGTGRGAVAFSLHEYDVVGIGVSTTFVCLAKITAEDHDVKLSIEKEITS